MLKFSCLTLLLVLCSSVCFADELGFQAAAKMYRVDSFKLRAISYVESRHNPKAVNRNKNGSKDLGHMQINNKVWSKSLDGHYEQLDDFPKYCTQVGAWIFRQCADRYPASVWDQFACYHAGIGYTDAKRLVVTDPGNREKWKKKERLGLIYANKIYRAMKILNGQ